MERRKLIGAYARLIGIRDLIITTVSNPEGEVGRDYNSVITGLNEILDDDMTPFLLGHEAFYSGGSGGTYVRHTMLASKVRQVISYLDRVYFAENEVIQIGSLFNAISDPDLRDRCSDLLSAPGNFDRAINQATLVLEDRIRRKSQVEDPLTGTPLVNKTLKSDPKQSILVVSSSASEQEGIANICRGIMQAFRNATHHRISDNFSREDALKFCGFVDNLLRIIGTAQVQDIGEDT